MKAAKRAFESWKAKIRHHFEEVWKVKTSPHSIALGFAVGTFFALLPTPGFSILLGFLVVLIFEKVNKFSLLAAMAIWNPIVLIPIYSLSYLIGDLLFGKLPYIELRFQFLEQAYNFSRQFIIGNTLLAIVFSVASYFILKGIAVAVHKRRDEEQKEAD